MLQIRNLFRFIAPLITTFTREESLNFAYWQVKITRFSAIFVHTWFIAPLITTFTREESLNFAYWQVKITRFSAIFVHTWFDAELEVCQSFAMLFALSMDGWLFTRVKMSVANTTIMRQIGRWSEIMFTKHQSSGSMGPSVKNIKKCWIKILIKLGHILDPDICPPQKLSIWIEGHC